MYLALWLSLSALAAPSGTTDVAYATTAGAQRGMAKLDVYRPASGPDRPLVVLVHGGSWVSGDKANFAKAPHFVDWWLDQGFVVAAVNFRLASKPGTTPRVGPRDQAGDIAHAIAWLHAHAADYGVAPQEPVVAVGYSSGAHLVALLGADERYLEAVGLPPAHLGATVSLDVHAYDVPYALELMKGSVVEKNMPLIRHLFGEQRQAQLDASPIHHIDGYVAPAMLVSVEPDPDKPGSHGYIVKRAAEHYADALRQAGHRVDTLHVSSLTHGELAMGFGGPEDPVAQAVARFLTGQPRGRETMRP